MANERSAYPGQGGEASDDDWTPPPPPQGRPLLGSPLPTPLPPPPPLPRIGASDSTTSLDTTPYRTELEPLDIPPHREITDHTDGVTGYGQGTGTGHRDQLTDLSLADEIRLLAENNIYLSTRVTQDDDTGLGAMAAYVVGATLMPADNLAVRFRKVSLLTADAPGRLDSVGCSYQDFESNLQRQLVTTQSKFEFGIPGIFKVNGSYGAASALATHDHKISMCFQKSQLVPKAKVVFEPSDLSLDEKFISKVKAACDARKTWADRADGLLPLLRDYGHFVALSTILGGRISLHEAKELSDWSHFEALKREFKTAADARFSADGVPVQAGGGVGTGNSMASTVALTEQARSLQMELRGGDERLATSLPGTLGNRWIDSMAPYLAWRTIGFNESSLVPIIELLPDDLPAVCKEILRRYFVQNLDCRKSDVAGHAHGKPFEQDISRIKRITEIVPNHDGNVDGLKVTYEIYDAAGSTSLISAPYGRYRGERYDSTIRLKEGEVITAIEACVDPKHDDGVVRQLAFVTNRGARYPSDTGFYGRNRGEQLKVIEAPRVRGIFGYTGAWVHAVGLSYLGLAANARSREFLLAMEPYLFPNGEYGALS